MRFTLNVGSFGSLNLARPSSVDVEPDASVKEGVAVAADRVPAGDSVSLASVHAVREVASINVPAAVMRSIDMWTSRNGRNAQACLSPRVAAPYLGAAGRVACLLVRFNGGSCRNGTSDAF